MQITATQIFGSRDLCCPLLSRVLCPLWSEKRFTDLQPLSPWLRLLCWPFWNVPPAFLGRQFSYRADPRLALKAERKLLSRLNTLLFQGSAILGTICGCSASSVQYLLAQTLEKMSQASSCSAQLPLARCLCLINKINSILLRVFPRCHCQAAHEFS
jgi:hypothetical protein